MPPLIAPSARHHMCLCVVEHRSLEASRTGIVNRVCTHHPDFVKARDKEVRHLNLRYVRAALLFFDQFSTPL